MALPTQGIPFCSQLEMVGLMTVGTPHPSAIHLALQIRPIVVHLVEDLAIRMVETGSQPFRDKIIEQRTTVLIVHADGMASRMTAGTLLRLSSRIEPGKIHHKSLIRVRGIG
jgi:hypothetical protein